MTIKEKLRNIFSLNNSTKLVDDQGIENDILKAKLNVLINRFENNSKEINNLKQIIDGSNS